MDDGCSGCGSIPVGGGVVAVEVVVVVGSVSNGSSVVVKNKLYRCRFYSDS